LVRTREKLISEQVYWIISSSRKGRPHAAPVWGIWKSGVFYSETDPNSVKGRNLGSNPAVVVHIQNGVDTVIVEGKAAREADSKVLKALLKGTHTSTITRLTGLTAGPRLCSGSGPAWYTRGGRRGCTPT